MLQKSVRSKWGVVGPPLEITLADIKSEVYKMNFWNLIVIIHRT